MTEGDCKHCGSANVVPIASTVDSLQRGGEIYIWGDRLVADLPCDYLSTQIKFCPMCGRKISESKEEAL